MPVSSSLPPRPHARIARHRGGRCVWRLATEGGARPSAGHIPYALGSVRAWPVAGAISPENRLLGWSNARSGNDRQCLAGERSASDGPGDETWVDGCPSCHCVGAGKFRGAARTWARRSDRGTRGSRSPVAEICCRASAFFMELGAEFHQRTCAVLGAARCEDPAAHGSPARCGSVE
jgi:hypothetical protein